MDNAQSFNEQTNYRTEVHNFGGKKPTFTINNLNEDNIDWSYITTDGQGNVLSMPLLRSKLCFGRIEYLFRHGHKDQPLVNQGPRMAAKPTKCSRCPSMTKTSCQKLVAERVHADENIKAAMRDWRNAGQEADNDPNMQNRAKLRYNRFDGPIFANLWGNCLEAIAERGPFSNSNDAATRDEIIDKAERKRIRDAKRQQSKRRIERLERQAARVEPPIQFTRAAERERDRRITQLMAARKLPKIHPRVSKLTDEGCELTGYAWYYETMQTAMGEKTKAGTMAKWLVEDEGLDHGKPYDTMKDRLRHDLARARAIEAGKLGDIWQEFNPDADLDL